MKKGPVYIEEEKFKIRSNPDPIEWEIPCLKALSEITKQRGKIASILLTGDFKSYLDFLREPSPKEEQSEVKPIPRYFLEPKANPPSTLLTGSRLLGDIATIDQFTKKDEYKKLVRFLIDNGVLEEEPFRLFKCHSDKEITIGKGNHCSVCGKQVSEANVIRIYSLPIEVIDILNQPGRILEGIIFNAIKEIIPKEVGATFVMNPSLEISDESEEPREIDVAFLNPNNNKALIILATINTTSKRIKNQLQLAAKANLETILVTTALNEKLRGLKEFEREKLTFVDSFDQQNKIGQLIETIKSKLS